MGMIEDSKGKQFPKTPNVHQSRKQHHALVSPCLVHLPMTLSGVPGSPAELFPRLCSVTNNRTMSELALAGDAGIPPAASDVIGSSGISGRRRHLNEKLDERHRERLETQAQRRQERAAELVETEREEHFWTAMNAEEAAARADLTGLTTASDRAAIGDALDSASRRLQTIHKFIADSSAFLNARNLKRAQEAAKQLHDHIQQRQDELIPRKKFGFRGKRAAKPDSKPEKPADVPSAVTPVAAAPAADECGFRDREGARLQLSGGDVTGRDVTLTCLTRCHVSVTGAPATVHMSHLRDCTVLLGPVATSVFLEDCHRVTFAVACQQLRAHSSQDCDVYLHVTSRAVVEHCQRLRFAPYNLTGCEVTADWKTTGLSTDRNNWDDVDDFNWLSKAQKSPNWSVLPEAERVSEFKVGGNAVPCGE